MTEDDKGALTVVGILSGGGIDCIKLGDPSYEPTTHGKWMRVSKFEKWIQKQISPGKKIFILKNLPKMSAFFAEKWYRLLSNLAHCK